jgi:deoxyribose-phosphate aldolase
VTLASSRKSILPDRITTPTLRTFLRSVPSVDEVGAQERVDTLSKRSIKKESKMDALKLIIQMIDLTTLEGQDTAGKVAQLSAKAIRPDPLDPEIPSAASVCIYPNMVKYAVEATEGTAVRVCSVATYFPSGLADTDLKVEETSRVVKDGADEVDMVIDRGAFLSGEYFKVFDEIRRVKDACGDAHLKVILETGELGTLDNVRRASMLAMAAGGDFIKTSTGKIAPAATLPVTLVMLEAIRDFQDATGEMVGMKPAGGIRTSKDAIKYLVVLNETLGEDWMTPEWFRFGASSLLNDVLMQIRWLKTGRYWSADYFTKD